MAEMPDSPPVRWQPRLASAGVGVISVRGGAGSVPQSSAHLLPSAPSGDVGSALRHFRPIHFIPVALDSRLNQSLCVWVRGSCGSLWIQCVCARVYSGGKPLSVTGCSESGPGVDGENIVCACTCVCVYVCVRAWSQWPPILERSLIHW